MYFEQNISILKKKKEQQQKNTKPPQNKQTTDIAPNISHTLDVQRTADSYPPLVVTSKVKTVLNTIWRHSNRWDKPDAEEYTAGGSRTQEKSDRIKLGQSEAM